MVSCGAVAQFAMGQRAQPPRSLDVNAAAAVWSSTKPPAAATRWRHLCLRLTPRIAYRTNHHAQAPAFSPQLALARRTRRGGTRHPSARRHARAHASRTQSAAQGATTPASSAHHDRHLSSAFCRRRFVGTGPTYERRRDAPDLVSTRGLVTPTDPDRNRTSLYKSGSVAGTYFVEPLVPNRFNGRADLPLRNVGLQGEDGCQSAFVTVLSHRPRRRRTSW